MRTRPSVIAASCVILVVVSVHAADPPITASQAGEHIGRRATVCGDVVAAVRMPAPRAGGEQLFLHFDQPPPNSPFIVGIVGTDLLNIAFKGIAKKVEHRTVCVTGNIKTKGTTPFMLVTGPNQLKVMAAPSTDPKG